MGDWNESNSVWSSAAGFKRQMPPPQGRHVRQFHWFSFCKLEALLWIRNLIVYTLCAQPTAPAGGVSSLPLSL